MTTSWSGVVEERTDDDAHRAAMETAGRFLARRPHARAELRTKLARSHPEGADRAVARLTELGLLDDHDFARQWVEERSSRRGVQALLAELEAKGVDREVAVAAVAEVEGSEEARAQDLASRHLAKVMAKPLAKQAASIQSMLLRRGYSPEVAQAATRAVLPPEGWD
jgi:regulatory protein